MPSHEDMYFIHGRLYLPAFLIPTRRNPGAFVMIHRSSQLLALLLLTVDMARLQGADFPTAEYELSVKRYLSSLEGLKVDFKRIDYSLDGEPASFAKECSVISTARHYRAGVVSRTTRNGKESAPYKDWALLRPDGYYQIEEKATGECLLKKMEDKVNSILLVDKGSSLSRLAAPISVAGYPIIRLIKGDFGKTIALRITTFRKTATGYSFNGELLVNKSTASVEVELDSNWLVERARVFYPAARNDFTTRITYTTFGDRVLPKRVTTDVSGPSLRKTPPAVMDFDEYSNYTGNTSDFSLAQFGLPETASRYRGRSYWFLVFIGIGCLLLAMGWYFRRRHRDQPQGDGAALITQVRS